MEVFRFIKPFKISSLEKFDVNDLVLYDVSYMGFYTRFGFFVLHLDDLEKVELRVGMEFILAYPSELKWKDATVVAQSEKLAFDGRIDAKLKKEDCVNLWPYAYHLRLPNEVSAVVEKKCTCDIMALMRVGCKCGGI